MQSFRGAEVLAAALALAPGWALAQDEHQHAHDASEKFGVVHFPTSCSRQVQPRFERGLALLHSFAYEQAAAVFREVSAKDAACGIAQWGLAMSYFHEIWAPPTEDEFAAGRTAAQKAPSDTDRAKPMPRAQTAHNSLKNKADTIIQHPSRFT